MNKAKVNFFGREFELKVVYDCYEGEEILSYQKEALQNFIENQYILDNDLEKLKNYCLNLNKEEIGEEIRSCGLYKSKSKKIKETSRMICENFEGEVPQTLKELTTLPGVGRKTADVVLSNAFNQDAIAVDTHVFRVTNRIGIVNEKTAEKTEFALMEVIPKNRWSHSHHLFIFHGRRMCKARKPECDLCPIREECNYYNSTQRND